jgi:predicted kinase
MANKQLLIMRGLPGSGKSFEVEKLRRHYQIPYEQIFASDDWWVRDVLAEMRASPPDQVDHDYYNELIKETYRSRWSPDTLGQAHGWNYGRFRGAVEAGVPMLIVDSVNGKARDMRGYVKLGEAHGYTITIWEPTSPWWLDHKEMLRDKQANGTALEDFARFLAGFHQGYEAKYGAKGNQHGVPLDAIRNMIRRWQPDLTVDDVAGRSGRFQD